MNPLLFLLPWLSSLVSLAVANTCSKVQACSVQLSRYPVLEEVGLQVAGSPQQSIAQEASGWGSGMVPLYDELMDEQTSVDYTASPEISTFSFCECGDNNTCDPSNESRNMNLDNSLKLTFCNDVDVQVHNACKGRRGVIRVIGPSDPAGTFIQSVTSTIVFCSCPAGYQRQAVEVWEAGVLSVHYTCV